MHVDTQQAPERVASSPWLPRTSPVDWSRKRPTTEAATRVKIPKLHTPEIDRAVQRVLIFSYATCVLAAVLGILFQPPSLASTTGELAAKVWALFTLISASGCLISVLLPRGVWGDWFGEYVGIPLLAAMVAMYGIAIVMSAADSSSGRAPAGVLLLGLVVLLYLRWRTVRTHAKDDTRPPTTTNR